MIPFTFVMVAFSNFKPILIKALDDFSIQTAVRLDRFSDFGWELTPKIGLLWRHSNIETFTNIGRNVRAPTFKDM